MLQNICTIIKLSKGNHLNGLLKKNLIKLIYYCGFFLIQKKPIYTLFLSSRGEKLITFMLKA